MLFTLCAVALDAATKANVAGVGSVSATLAGTKLVISGTFDGLPSPATEAQIRQKSAASGVAFVGGLDRMFRAVDVKTGTVLWQRGCRRRCRVSRWRSAWAGESTSRCRHV